MTKEEFGEVKTQHLEATIGGHHFEFRGTLDQRVFEMYDKWILLASKSLPSTPPTPTT